MPFISGPHRIALFIRSRINRFCLTMLTNLVANRAQQAQRAYCAKCDHKSFVLCVIEFCSDTVNGIAGWVCGFLEIRFETT